MKSITRRKRFSMVFFRTKAPVLSALLVVILLLYGCAAGQPVESALVSIDTSGDESFSLEPTQQSSLLPESQPEVSQPEEEPLAEGQRWALAELEKMTLRQKVGQLFLFRCPDENGAETVEEYQPAGYFLMASHFRGKTRDQAVEMIASFQRAARLPLAIAVDEEGGTVVRISLFPELAPEKFPSPQQVYASGGIDGIRQDAIAKSRLLKSYGVNVNLAPVADLSVNPEDFIYDRSFGKNAEETEEFVRTVVQASSQEGVSSTLKHFPGYGNNGDTHIGIAYDKRPRTVFETEDFLPFAAGIEAGAPCVLVSHNIVECMDPKHPASLSPEIHRILREELKFTGVIMTDDLVMGAIREYTGDKSPAPAALLAGNDLLLSSNLLEDFNALYTAAETGEIPLERIDESVLRVLMWKYDWDIVEKES